MSLEADLFRLLQSSARMDREKTKSIEQILSMLDPGVETLVSPVITRTGTGMEQLPFLPVRTGTNVHMPMPVLEPERVIFSPPATVVYWKDGTKTVVRCENDVFSEEFGYAMACMRRMYGTRAAFKARFKNAWRPQLAPQKKKKAAIRENIAMPAGSSDGTDTGTSFPHPIDIYEDDMK